MVIRLAGITRGAFLVVVCAAVVLPFLYLIAISFSSYSAIVGMEVTFFPVGFNTENYQRIFAQRTFWSGYRNTLLYTVVGSTLAVALTMMAAFPLSQPDFRYRRVATMLVVVTLFFNGGLIPTYLVVRGLGLIDSMWAVILPVVINPWNLIITRTFLQGIPRSLIEAAEIDGLAPHRILIQIIVPLSTAIIATISLFYAVWYWNDWFRALIYLNSTSRMPVTIFLRNIVVGSTLAAREGMVIEQEATSPTTLQAASIVVVALPIILIYPFLQRYFVKGVMIGSLKG